MDLMGRLFSAPCWCGRGKRLQSELKEVAAPVLVGIKRGALQGDDTEMRACAHGLC